MTQNEVALPTHVRDRVLSAEEMKEVEDAALVVHVESLKPSLAPGYAALAVPSPTAAEAKRMRCLEAIAKVGKPYDNS